MQDKRWTILNPRKEDVETLRDCLNINPAICRTLAARGISGYTSAKQYFRPQLSELHDPMLMKDMDKAVARILRAFKQKEKVLVFGDYDVDGTTAVSCMVRFLRRVYDSELIEYYIPNRYREGYGVSREGIDFAATNNFTLIISVDCGIKSVELVSYASTLEIDFIICDHHLPDDELPPASAILNAKQPGCGYPYKELCGCGVAFKLICALANQLGIDDAEIHTYLDLVATAIAADIVPITGENRILSYYGLKKINDDPCNGIKALMELAATSKELKNTNLVFIIAPRVNAAGRMDDARKAVQLFIEEDYEKAIGFAAMLHSDNDLRKEADSTITEEALAMIDGDLVMQGRNTTVVFQPGWSKGVVGIVASRLIEKHYKPTVVLTRSGDIVAGSARSISGFNLYEAIHACREHLIGYGGHFAAAGLTMHPESVGPFTLKFEEAVNASCDPFLFQPEIIIDTEIRFAEITSGIYRLLDQMEPFGPGNMRPVFLARNVSNTIYTRIVKDDHIRFVVSQDGRTITGIGFNLAHKFEALKPGSLVDIVFTIDENEWNGETSIQLKIIDVRNSIPTTEPQQAAN